MALRIKSRSGESVEQMLRRFKKMCEKEGLIKDVKKNAYFEKPSERRRRAARKSIKRQQMKDMPFVANAKGGPRTGPGSRPGRPGGRPPGGRPPRPPRPS